MAELSDAMRRIQQAAANGTDALTVLRTAATRAKEENERLAQRIADDKEPPC